MTKNIRILELYSGIGGMHHAVHESGLNFEVVAAVDINTTANTIYKYNFPNTKLFNRCIESITLKEWDKLQFDMILMSPPCQPFCRVGKQQDVDDVRTKSFLSLLDTLPRLAAPPSYILVENVKGFDTSQSRKMLLDVLNDMDYTVQEFLLSPLQFGIPNSRLRYYLIAKKKPLKFMFETTTHIQEDIPSCVSDMLIHRVKSQVDCDALHSTARDATESNCNKCSQDQNVAEESLHQCCSCDSNAGNNEMIEGACGYSDAKLKRNKFDETNTDVNSEKNNEQPVLPLYEKYKLICTNVGKYLEKQEEKYFEQYLIPEKFLKRFWVMDIVNANSKNSCCFTKRYAHHIEGSGSVVQMNTQFEKDLSHFKKRRIYDETVEEAVRCRKLRFFTPKEISNLMCFPESFRFPEEISNIQCYRVLGNSLNVHVVAVMIKLMTLNDNIKQSCIIFNSNSKQVLS